MLNYPGMAKDSLELILRKGNCNRVCYLKLHNTCFCSNIVWSSYALLRVEANGRSSLLESLPWSPQTPRPESLGIEGGCNEERGSFAFGTGILQPQCPDMAAQGAVAPLTTTANCGESQFLLHRGFHSSKKWVGGKTEDHPPNRLQAVP